MQNILCSALCQFRHFDRRQLFSEQLAGQNSQHTSSWMNDDDEMWWVDRLCSPALTANNSHERAGDTIWWRVRFSDHDGMRMEGGSCVAVLVANSTRTVLPQQSCEDHIGLSLWLELLDHHVQMSVGDGSQRYQRPAGTW